ncbi:MAG: hypothetical protein V4572_10995 [Bacteroidota bacterium]
MKKILCLFSALALVLTSCSGDDSSSDSSPDSSTILLKKTILTDSEGEKTTVIYKYNGTKIVSELDNYGDGILYTYTGDLITKMEFKYDGIIEQTNTYSYTDGKLTTFVREDPIMDWGNKEVYTHNSDGSISVKEYIGDGTTQTQLNSTGTINFFANGEVSEITSSNNLTYKYVYDTKNNPFKNVLGFGKIAFVDGIADGISHNMISETYGTEVTYTATYVYNSNNYPKTVVDNEDGEETKIQCFY